MPGQPGWLLAIDFVRFRTIPSWGMHSQLASDRPCVRQILPKWFNISAMTLARSPHRVLAERRTSSRSGDGHKGGAWSGNGWFAFRRVSPATSRNAESDGSLGAKLNTGPPLGLASKFRQAICCSLLLHCSDRGTFQTQWQPDRRWKRRA